METKGIPVQDSQVNVTNESVGNAQGVGSNQTIHGELGKLLPGAQQMALLYRYRKKQFDSLQGQEEKLFFQDNLSNEIFQWNKYWKQVIWMTLQSF